MKFSQWLRQELLRRDMKQADLARFVGTSTGAVSDWVNGKTVPSPASVDLIADALRIDPDRVLTIAGHRPRLPKEEVEQYLADVRPFIEHMDNGDREIVKAVARSLAHSAEIRREHERTQAIPEEVMHLGK